ncbi:MAG: hypothetical protein J0M02_13110 [Planctomycetes bacterium]|nr:hypothetical protein [Planctomycetota bacterium]
MPTVRLHAARIGMHPEKRTGDAWEVEAWIDKGKVRLRVKAERIELRADRLTFHGVETDFGHGGALSMRCPTLNVYLREELRMDKGSDQIDRYVEGIEAVGPTIRAAGVPVLWFPYLYRDYVLDYPWSTVEAGHSERLGWYARYRVGSNLPEVAGWRTRLEGRADRHTRSGNGFGLAAYWQNRTMGRGSASVYRMYRERVADPAEQSQQGGERDVNLWDAEHYVSGTGWAAAARYTVLPDADPSQTLPDGRSPDERFRADYDRAGLEEKPFARQGVGAAWVTPWAAFAADVERRPNDDLDETERLFGAEAAIPRLGLAGPLAVQGRARAERLRQEVQDTEASRLSWDGALAAVRWFGGFAVDASGGLRGVSWSDGRLAGSELSGSEDEQVPYAGAGLRLRLVSGDGQGSRYELVPRIGISWLGEDFGGSNPGFDFGDGVDTPESDRQYLTTALDAAATLAGARFSGEIEARWGLRERDLQAEEKDGTVRTSSSSLADIRFKARGKPRADIDTEADGTWDARLARWTTFDVRGRWRVAEPVEMLYNGAYVPPTATVGDSWMHRAGGSLYLSRYRVDAWGEVRPGADGEDGGRSLDLWHLGFVRRLVDGIAGLSYENAYQPDEGIDHRVAFTFIVGGDSLERADAARRAFGF